MGGRGPLTHCDTHASQASRAPPHPPPRTPPPWIKAEEAPHPRPGSSLSSSGGGGGGGMVGGEGPLPPRILAGGLGPGRQGLYPAEGGECVLGSGCVCGGGGAGRQGLYPAEGGECVLGSGCVCVGGVCGGGGGRKAGAVPCRGGECGGSAPACWVCVGGGARHPLPTPCPIPPTPQCALPPPYTHADAMEGASNIPGRPHIYPMPRHPLGLLRRLLELIKVWWGVCVCV